MKEPRKEKGNCQQNKYGRWSSHLLATAALIKASWKTSLSPSPDSTKDWITASLWLTTASTGLSPKTSQCIHSLWLVLQFSRTYCVSYNHACQQEGMELTEASLGKLLTHNWVKTSYDQESGGATCTTIHHRAGLLKNAADDAGPLLDMSCYGYSLSALVHGLEAWPQIWLTHKRLDTILEK